MKYLTTLCAALTAHLICPAAAAYAPTYYKDPAAPVDVRVEDLLSRMTLREKVMQTSLDVLGINANPNNLGETTGRLPADIGVLIYTQWMPALRDTMQHRAMTESRLGIPALIGFDVIHGFRTIYPISLAQACSWNTSLTRDCAAMAARESKSAGVDWTFSPMIDVCRDPRWGRVSEGYGEDPLLQARFCEATVLGYQGESLSPSSVAACLKHFVGYGASAGGRDYVTTDVSDQALWDTYLPPYKAGVDAGAASVMSSFNDINGVPGTANRHTLTEILKERWQFDGPVVGDWDAVRQLIPQGYAADLPEAAAKSINAGLDIDMSSHAYDRHLESLVQQGIVPMERLDDAVRRILRLKFRLGLFDNPYTACPNPTFLATPDLDLVRRAAEESMVLLRNDTLYDNEPLLPLNSSIYRRIAVVGPGAKKQDVLLGSWHAHGIPSEATSLYDGISAAFPCAEVSYAAGCATDGTDTTGFGDAVAAARAADVTILCLCEENAWSGENASRAGISLPAIQEKLAEAVAGAGKPVVLVLVNGRPLDLTRLEPHVGAIIEAWQPGLRGGEALGGILSGTVNPSGRLAITFPVNASQIPVHYAERPKSRADQGHYQDMPDAPRFPFGYGLSYTTFRYGEPTASTSTFHKGETVTVTVPVTNTGTRAGAETVMWYTGDPVCSITQPVRRLRHFEKQMIQPGETRVFTFEIDPLRDLAATDSRGGRLLEPGEYTVTVGGRTLSLQLVP